MCTWIPWQPWAWICCTTGFYFLWQPPMIWTERTPPYSKAEANLLLQCMWCQFSYIWTWWCWSSVGDLRSMICFTANCRSSSSTLMASFMLYIWLRLNHCLISQKWQCTMLFPMGRLLGFTWVGRSAVSMFLGWEMIYTRNIATMSRLLEIIRQPWEMSIHLMEQHLPSPMMLLLQSFLILMVMVRLVGRRRC